MVVDAVAATVGIAIVVVVVVAVGRVVVVPVVVGGAVAVGVVDAGVFAVGNVVVVANAFGPGNPMTPGLMARSIFSAPRVFLCMVPRRIRDVVLVALAPILALANRSGLDPFVPFPIAHMVDFSFDNEKSQTLEMTKGSLLMQVLPDQEFLKRVAREVESARTQFPEASLTLAALTEEVGELAKALLEEPSYRVYREAVQVAAMALRVAVEGDRTLDAHRKRDKLDCYPPPPLVDPDDEPAMAAYRNRDPHPVEPVAGAYYLLKHAPPGLVVLTVNQRAELLRLLEGHADV
jgi:hypothetical protein